MGYGGFRDGIGCVHAFTVAVTWAWRKAAQLYDCSLNCKLKSLDKLRDWMFTSPTPQRCGWERNMTAFNRDGSPLVWTVITLAVVIVIAIRAGGVL